VLVCLVLWGVVVMLGLLAWLQGLFGSAR
jgi:hypothetical protein